MPPKPQPTNSQIFKAFWVGLRPQGWKFLLVAIFIIITNIIVVVVPIFYKDFFDIIQVATDRNAAGPELVRILLIIAVLHFGQWLFYGSAMFLLISAEIQTMAQLKRNAFNYLLKHSHTFFADNFTGSLVQKINRFSRAIEKISETVNFQIIPLTVMVVGSLIVTYALAPIISLIICMWVVLFISFNYVYSRRIIKYNIIAAAADSKTGAVLADSVGNHSAITNFAGARHEEEGFKAVTQEWIAKSKKIWNLREISARIQVCLLFIVEFFVFYYAIIFWQKDAITVGTFVLIQIYVVGLAMQLWNIGRIVRNFHEAMADSREMVEILVTPYEITDISSAKKLEVTAGEINLKDISFTYGSNNKEILHGINLTVSPGEKIGLIGPSGAGKTTITRLLLRLHNITSGVILIDGQDISQVTQESLREKISLVPQEPVLFHRTLLENIRYGRRDATDEEVIAAAKLAHCDDFIDVLPNKYETLVGERGVKLSGGERQRVAIARAILKNAPILILDEATSSLDSHSESLIQKALDALMQGRTSIVIAHRLSTIRKMDRIIVMENGAIREEGTHDALIKNDSSLYKKLWDLQMGGFIVE